jgi:hypothetical protein
MDTINNIFSGFAVSIFKYFLSVGQSPRARRGFRSYDKCKRKPMIVRGNNQLSPVAVPKNPKKPWQSEEQRKSIDYNYTVQSERSVMSQRTHCKQSHSVVVREMFLIVSTGLHASYWCGIWIRVDSRVSGWTWGVSITRQESKVWCGTGESTRRYGVGYEIQLTRCLYVPRSYMQITMRREIKRVRCTTPPLDRRGQRSYVRRQVYCGFCRARLD